jgi:hypothetical protein
MAHFWQGCFWSAFPARDWLTVARTRLQLVLLVAVWLVASFAAYLAMLRAILPRGETLLIAGRLPRRSSSMGHGQNGFLTAALLATVYVLDYDLFVLAVASLRHGLQYGFRNYEISLLAAAWLVPLLSRGIAGATGVPLGLMVMLAFYGFVLRRAVHDHAIANEASAGASVMRFVLPCSAQP